MSSSKDLGFVHKYVSSSDPSSVTLLLLHGTGGDENDLLNLGRAVAPNANLLSPRGKVLENGAPRFFRRLAEGVFDQEDLAKRTQELAEFVALAAQAYRFNPKRVVAAGFSNGANIAASLLLRGTNILSGAILWRPMVPFEPKTSPALDGVPVFIAAGQFDPIVPTWQTDRLVEILRGARADVTLQREAQSHGLEQSDVAGAKAWFDTAAGAKVQP